jgi:hypothetical protein
MSIFEASEKMIDWIGTKTIEEPEDYGWYTKTQIYDLIIKCFPSDMPDVATG